MDDKLFRQLMDSVRWAKDHMAGKPVEVGRVSVVKIVDVKRSRIATKPVQSPLNGSNKLF